MTVRHVRPLLAALAVALWLLQGISPAAAVTVERVTSPGGIEAWLVRDRSVPLLSIEFSFRGGAALDPAGKEGLANLTTTLLDEGAGDLDSQAFQRKLNDLSIRLGFSANLETIAGRLKTLNRNRAEAIELLRLALTEPRFDADAVERMRRQQLTAFARRANDPNTIVSLTRWKAMFPDHPYGRPVQGTAETVAGFTVADMRRLLAERFARDQLIIGVVGDITPGELGPILDRAFGGLPAKGKPARLAETMPADPGQTYVVELDVPQSVVSFGHAGIKRNDPDWYAASVMNYVLGGGSFASRLYDEVREKRGLAYSVYSYLKPLNASAFYGGGVSTANERVGEAIEVIRAEWKRLRDGGVTAAELRDAKTYMTGSYALGFTSTNQIARTLVGVQYFGLGIDYIDRRNGFIEAVTAQDVARIAKRLLDPDALTVVVVGKPEGVTPTAEAPKVGG